MISAKPLRIRFNKIDGFSRVYDGTKYLVLFGAGKCDLIYNRIRYLIRVKSVITYVILIIMQKSKVDSYDSLPLEKTLTLDNIVVLITKG